MLFPARPRATVTRLPGPMAVPLERVQSPSLTRRVASGAQDLLTQARTEAVRRIVLWLLVSVCVGTLALAYLLQTSHVASLASQRGQLEQETAKLRDANARLAAKAAGFQTLTRADAAARQQGLREATAGSIAYISLPDVADLPPAPPAAGTHAPGLPQRIRSALTNHASAESRRATAIATPGAHP